MRPWLIVGAAVALLLASMAARGPVLAAPAPLRALVVTGGHDYPTSFYTVFEQDGIAWDHATSLEAAFKENPAPKYDVVVLYNMALQPAEAVQKNVQAYLEQGGGLLVLHHGILNFEESDWFRDVVGGRYLLNPKDGMPASTYLHDQDLDVGVVTPHPITRGVSLTRIHDETYKGMWIAKTNTVLLATKNATSDGPLAWVSDYAKARVVYIQLGHGSEAHHDPGYRALVKNAALWVAHRLD
jgi:uncharacterized protein